MFTLPDTRDKHFVAWRQYRDFRSNMEFFSKSRVKFAKNEEKFYKDAKDYWSRIDPTVDGMLGGFGCISTIDIEGSELFLQKIYEMRNPPGKQRALDCGAGIGRITKHLLAKKFGTVDLVEQDPKFVDTSKRFLACNRNIGKFYVCGLQNFTPRENFYDVIWCQWVLGHLTDTHLTEFLVRCKKGLRPNGVIIVKENVSTLNIVMDEEDSSVTRPTNAFKKIFDSANLGIIKHSKQANFPKQLLVVKIFALQPKEWIPPPEPKF